MAKLKVLVAGGSGQVARSLAASVPAQGIEATCLGRPALDICDRASVQRAFDTVRPGLVINAAAYTAVDQAETEPDQAVEVNARAAGALAAAAAERGAPMLHLSTDYVFDGSKPAPYVETDPVSPLGAYGRSKLEGESLVTAANPQAVILRTAWVYSAYGRNFAKTMLRLADSRDEVSVVDDQRGNPTSAADIAAALWQIALRYAEDPASLNPGVFHMTASGEASWADFAEEIFRLSAGSGGPSARIRRITTADYPTPARRPENSRLDCRKLALAYGLTLPPWQQSADRVVSELIKTQGWNA